jgi:DNA repair exonuclease SbcCD ATPase subunit
MKLLRLKADGFGPLRGEWHFDPERVTLVIDDNERGKSSLLAAITAALYGLDADRRSHRVLTPLERWRPWSGEGFRVELELQIDDTRYTVKRDFDKGTVEVWNAQGREVTTEFREGKDAYPVGVKLLELDQAEWEKCAFIRQDDLADVVPVDEKNRRASTLRARLESAADTHIGDTSASEAVRVLEQAADQYTCDEIGSTMKVENVIKALEAKRGLVDVDLKTLENDFENMAGPLEELARRTDDERQAREELARLDGARRGSVGAEIRRQIEADAARREELARLREEAESLAAAAQLPAGAEAELRETIARYEEAQRSLDALEARGREEQARERKAIEGERENVQQYDHCTPDDADRFVALAAEIRRIGEADSRLKDNVFSQREALASRGYEPERIQALSARFEGLTADQQKMLRNQAEVSLGFQTEVATLEQARTSSTETLRDIDAARNGRRLPGWFLLALGLGGAVAGVSVMALGGLLALWNGLLIGGLALVLVGWVLLASGANLRQVDREESLRKLSEAQRRLSQIRQQRTQFEVGLNEMCTKMGYRDPVELAREWNEYMRIMEDSAPVLRAQEGISALETQRKAVLDSVRELLEKVGGGSPDPAHLERVAAGIRHAWAIKQRTESLETSWSWIDDEKRTAEATATGLKERAVRILQSAGLAYDPEQPWATHVSDLAERLKGRSRHRTLVEEVIPATERNLLSDAELEEKKKHLDALESDGIETPAADAPARSQVEIDREVQRVNKRLNEIQNWRADLRLGVEEQWRRHHREHPEKAALLGRLDAALERARRFEKSVRMAYETIQSVAESTHRRWAEHLNQRVSELLKAVGTGVTEVRFGDDLDFSIKYDDGRQVARGKAMMQLSSGAQDQLHFAVRLAVSEFLSRGRASLPLLIDDAFASSDDARTRAAMELLVGTFAAQHQVIVVTCHRGRFEALAESVPELGEARVRRVSLTDGARTRS